MMRHSKVKGLEIDLSFISISSNSFSKLFIFYISKNKASEWIFISSILSSFLLILFFLAAVFSNDKILKNRFNFKIICKNI